MNWKDVPIPRRMNAMQKDSRGYPIPFIVLRDINGDPHFAANDSRKQLRCLFEKRCPICGTKLDKLMWFAGGPQSAFAEHGVYIDTGMHHECMQYAMQVCPYLAMPRYMKSIGMSGITPENTPPGINIFIDPTQTPERPVVFVVAGTENFRIKEAPGHMLYVIPQRPYHAIEYWRYGKNLSEAEGRQIISDARPELTI